MSDSNTWRQENLLTRFRENAIAITSVISGVVAPTAAWCFLSPWAAIPITVGGVLTAFGANAFEALPRSSRPFMGAFFGTMIGGAVALMSVNQFDAENPSTTPSVIAATMNEMCWRQDEKFSVQVATPDAQRSALAENGLSRSVGPVYAQHGDPDPSTQWVRPYVPGTLQRNPYYTAKVAPYSEGGSLPADKKLKTYVVQIIGIDENASGQKTANYDVKYPYRSWWTGKPVQVEEKYVTAARPEVCPAGNSMVLTQR